MKIKVLLVVPMLETGGGQKLAIDIATKIDKSQFDVCLLSLHPRCGMPFEKMADERGINTVYLSKRKGLNSRVIKDVYDIYNVIREYRPDVIHTHLYVVPYVLMPAAAAGVKIRIHTVHTLASRETKGFRRIIMRAAYNFFGFIPVVISDFNKANFLGEYGHQKNKVVTIYNGVDTSIFFRNGDLKRSNSSRFRFISTGRFEPVKNHKMMIEAFYLTHENYKDTELVLVGDGELKTEIEALIRKHELTESVILAGTSDCVAEELNKAQAYLSASDVEGLPLTVLEAMACELPVLTTEAGGVVDLVKNGGNGFVTPTGDAKALSDSMVAVLTNDELRTRMGRNNRKRAVELDLKICVGKYQKLYGEGDLNLENIISDKR